MNPKPYLYARLVEGLLGDALAITGNRAGLEQLRRQIGRALEGAEEWPHADDVYLDSHGQKHEVVIKLARSRAELTEQAKRPRPEKTAERLPWAEAARRTREGPGADERGPRGEGM